MTIFTKQITVNASGGEAPYTYAWSFVSGDAGIAVSNPNLHNPSFTKTDDYNYTGTAVWNIAVTDAQGLVQQQNITIRFMPVQAMGLANAVSLQMQFKTIPVTLASVPVDYTANGGVAPYTYLWSRNTTPGSITDEYTGLALDTNITTKSTLNSLTVANPIASAPVNNGELFAEGWNLAITDALGTVYNTGAMFVFRQYAQLNVTVPAATTVDNTTSTDISNDFTKTITATAVDGIGNYSYLWECISNGGVSLAVAIYGDDTNTLEVMYEVADAAPLNEQWRCTVTDGSGATDTVTHSFMLSHTQEAPAAGSLTMSYGEVDRDTNSGHVYVVWLNSEMGIGNTEDWVNAYLVPNLLPGKTANLVDYDDKVIITVGTYRALDNAGPTSNVTLIDSNDVPITVSPGITTGTTQFFDVNDVPITGPIPTTFTISAPRVSNEQY